eukprot:CAMPEP_0185259294 /NCGR_PEP_ID=MMETSP1359-20130426/8088_1 /TAXON_ID=552665 /ORGANISM="Bigelowiella longifila, Strain CCMP242" /LENGTH=317 /DNA_ID=CAMNT_0027845147 /DNA_START=141 /DNA_END=1094 /DNA_ORIENTATION=+
MKDVREVFDPKPVGGDSGSAKETSSHIGRNDIVRPDGFKIMVDARFEELMEACVDGDLEMVQKILKERPHSINHRSVVMPLHAAVQHKRKSVVVWLLENGANVNARTEDGSTALALAAYNGDLEMVKMLIERGADPSVKNQQGFNTLDVVEQMQWPEIKEYLLTPGRLQNAARLGDLATITRMLKKKPWRVNEIRVYAPLHAAARYNHSQMARFLLDQGAEVDIQMLDASTPLILAASEGYVEMVKCLIANGADLGHVNSMGFDALKAAQMTNQSHITSIIGSYYENNSNDDDGRNGAEGVKDVKNNQAAARGKEEL